MLLSVGDNVLAMQAVQRLRRGARQILSTLQRTTAAGDRAYAVMGHTHVHEVSEIAQAAGEAVYVNTGTWNPANLPTSVKFAGTARYRFAHFLRGAEDGYSLSAIAWDDGTRSELSFGGVPEGDGRSAANTSPAHAGSCWRALIDETGTRLAPVRA
jgi:hypothetical protein